MTNKTLEQELSELEKKFKSEREAIRKKHELISLLPEGITPKHIHIASSLYGTRFGITFEVEKLSQVQSIFKLIPGIELVDFKSESGRAIRPNQTIPMKLWEQVNEGKATCRTGLAPFFIEISNYGNSPCVKVQWYFEIKNEEIGWASVEIKQPRIWLTRQRDNGFYADRSRYSGPTTVHSAGQFKVPCWYEISYSPLDSQHMHDKKITWAQGQGDTPGEVFGEEGVISKADLAMEEKRQKFANCLYEFPVPLTSTGNWNADDWIKYIDVCGKWL